MLASVLLVWIPCLAVDFVPATDLPQHVAQVRLLGECWGLVPATVDTSLLVTRPLGVNTMVYAPLFLLAQVFPARVAGRLLVACLLSASALAIHHLARTRQRSPAHALLCTMLLFSAPLYWGLLNFLSGLPLWLWYVSRTLDDARESRRSLLLDAALVLALLWAHVFWVLLAGLVVALRMLHTRRLARLLPFLPALALIAAWYPTLVEARRSAGFSLATHYLIPVLARFRGEWLVETLFGGVRGWLEPAFTLLLFAYVATVLVRARGHGWDRALLALASALVLFVLLAPDQHLNTIFLNRRFLPLAVSLLLLALPDPDQRWLRVASSAATVAFVLFTTFAWSLFDQLDLAGLRESLARVPPGASVLGLDYRALSPFIRARPFLQLAGYAQAEHGGELGFSFAEHASSAVSYRSPRVLHWTPGLEWLPNRARRTDIEQFDCVLVNADPDEHERFHALSGRPAEPREGFFRAYCR